MKKILVISVSSLLLLSSCGTYTGAGAYTGGSFGSIIGSAIGGIAGGPRGSDIGTLIGMAGGAAIGAAVGAAADNAEQRRYEDYRAQRNQQRQIQGREEYDNTCYDEPNSGFNESNSGDDRLYGFGEDLSSSVEAVETATPNLEIRHAKLLDASRDGVLSRGEEARMVFEIYNNSQVPVRRIQPSVSEITGNRHIHISENVLVESILPGKGIRYTAVIKADNRLKDGDAIIRIAVLQANKEITSQTQEFHIQTSKR